MQMIRLYKDPEGDTIFTHVTNDATGAAGGTALATCDDHERVITLEKRIKALQAQLAASTEVQLNLIPRMSTPSLEMLNGLLIRLHKAVDSKDLHHIIICT